MKNLLFFFLFFSCQNLIGQTVKSDLPGLWGVTKVTVGEQQMTPIAKWVEFKSDLTHRGGNGWVQHSIGTWELEGINSKLNIITSNGTEDPFGGFIIQINNGEMTWQREEEGMAVKVFLKKIKEIPAAYSDKMLGLWQVESSVTVSPVLFNQNTKVFIRMDRRYSIMYAEGRKNGVWNTHAHRHQVRLLSDEGDEFDLRWNVSFEGEKMIWDNGADANGRIVFVRIHQF
ncbi:MAG: hypothetical protein AAFZ15_02840 [Bacteroidota bacterium]